MRELAPGDPVQPRHRRALVGPEAVGAVERGGERLRRQVGGELGVARTAHEVREQRRDMAAVEHRERVGLGPAGGEQVFVGARIHLPPT
jgi:hypothetical protein